MVLRQPYNGERFAQAAHTLREMINRLPVSLGLSSEALNERMGDKLSAPEQAWRRALAASSCFDGSGWSGTIDRPLERALTTIGTFFRWKESHRPRRSDEMAQTIRTLDASGRALPGKIERLIVEEWNEIRDYFISVCHYRLTADEGEFGAYLDVLERFLVDRLQPRTFADFDEVDAILKEAGSGD
jgi:hypothetical protein